MIETTSAGGIILNSKNQIALVADEYKIWMFPKGHQDMSETLLETARRKIYDELGITNLELLMELGMYQRFSMNDDGSDDRNKLKNIKMYVFMTTQEVLEPHAEDIKEAKWFIYEDAIKKLSHPKDQEMLKFALENVSNLKKGT